LINILYTNAPLSKLLTIVGSYGYLYQWNRDLPHQVLLKKKKNIPRFVLPQRILGDNDPAFIFQITQEMVVDLGINYHLYSAWRLQASYKMERANQILKQALAKLCQEIAVDGIHLLPVALMRIRNTVELRSVSAL
jgi:hypothetical protein